MTTTPTQPARDERDGPPSSASPATPRPQRPDGAATNPPDQIGAWLDRLLRLARLPARESAELRDELDAHLRERVRDLMLAGHDEPGAIHKSISELGDLALLAQRYREAHKTPNRRVIMHAAVIATAAAALGLSTVAYQQSQPTTQPEPLAELHPEPAAESLLQLGLVPQEVGPDGQGTYQIGRIPDRAFIQGLALRGFNMQSADDLGEGVYSIEVEPRQPEAVVPVLKDVPVISTLFTQKDQPTRSITQDIDQALLTDVLSLIAESQDLKPYIHWRDIMAEPETELTNLPLEGQQLPRAFEMINDALELDGQLILEYRAEHGLFEVASREYFDMRDRELVTYEVADLVYAEGPLSVTEESQVLVGLITEIIEPDAWQQHGGIAATVSAVGGKLFVHAPPRIHERVAWLLTQLSEDDEHSAADRERVLLDFIASTITRQDPESPAMITLDEVFRAAAASPAVSEDPALEETVRAAIEAAQPDTEIISLSHTSAADIAPIIDRAIKPLGASAKTYPGPNAVIVRGDATALEVARTLAQALDTRPPQPGDARTDRTGNAHYTVREGDSLATIAQHKLGDATLADSIREANPGLEPGELAVGQELRLPTGLLPGTTAAEPTPSRR